MRARIIELGEVNAGLEHSKRAMQIEKDDIVQSYRAVINEKRKLESDLLAMGELKERSGVTANETANQVHYIILLDSFHSITYTYIYVYIPTLLYANIHIYTHTLIYIYAMLFLSLLN